MRARLAVIVWLVMLTGLGTLRLAEVFVGVASPIAAASAALASYAMFWVGRSTERRLREAKER